jgi:TRAP-type C4-dicarboxylate transport system permease small subunit
MLERIFSTLERSFRFAASVLFVAMLGAVLVQIVARYALSSTPIWTEEITRFMLIFMTAFACGSAVRRRELVNVDIVVGLLPPWLRRLTATLVDLVTLTFGAAFFYYSIEYVQRSAMQQATTLPFSMAWIALAVLIIAGSLVLFTSANLVDDLRGDRKENP